MLFQPRQPQFLSVGACRTKRTVLGSLRRRTTRPQTLQRIFSWPSRWKSAINYYSYFLYSPCMCTCFILQTYVWKNIDESTEALASCLINAQPLPAHSPAADDNSLIGCRRPRPDRWLVAAYAHFVDSLCPFRCSFGCVLLWNQMFWKQCTLRQYRSNLSDQSALGIRVRNLG